MKVRLTILAENDVPVSQLGSISEEKLRKVYEALFTFLCLENGDEVTVEKIEVLHETD